MPLSEYESRMLAQIADTLGADDPRLASILRHGKPRGSAVSRAQGAALCVFGLALMLSGLALRASMIGGFPVLSVLGYLVMWGGAAHLVTVPVIRRAVRMAANVARWAREEPSRRG